MPKISEEPLQLLQVRIFKSDDSRLDALCGPKLNKNRLIRTIIRTYLNNTEAAINKRIDEMEETNGQERQSY